MQMTLKNALRSVAGSVVVMGWLVSGISPAEAGGFHTCMNELGRQGVLDPATQCWPCRTNPDLPICQMQGSGGSSGRSGSGSRGRSGGGSSSGSSDGPDTSDMRKIWRDSETGVSHDCVGQVGQPRRRLMGMVDIRIENHCGSKITMEQVCSSAGLRPFGNSSDIWTVHANSSTIAQCELRGSK